jgi:hypothetical protein
MPPQTMQSAGDKLLIVAGRDNATEETFGQYAARCTSLLLRLQRLDPRLAQIRVLSRSGSAIEDAPSDMYELVSGVFGSLSRADASRVFRSQTPRRLSGSFG